MFDEISFNIPPSYAGYCISASQGHIITTIQQRKVSSNQTVNAIGVSFLSFEHISLRL